MKSLGMILGGLYIVDALVAFLGGREAVRWTDATIGDNLPRSWKSVLREMKGVDRRVITAWGINNLVAGAGMVLVALLAKPREATEQ